MKIKKYLVLFMLVLIIAVSAGFFTSQLGHFKKVADWGADRGQAGPSEPEEPPDRGEEAAPAEEPETPPPAEDPVMATAHFARDEYRCDCAGSCDGWPCEMNPELLDKIEALRCACGAPVIITSGVRCEARNAEVGGVSWSFHKRGEAAVLFCPGVAVGDLAQMAKALGMNVLPYYGSGYIHVEI